MTVDGRKVISKNRAPSNKWNTWFVDECGAITRVVNQLGFEKWRTADGSRGGGV
jgi:hypothetical protein